jgi:sigma-B regulation protein RsbU (phosphoserine phosphatase)
MPMLHFRDPDGVERAFALEGDVVSFGRLRHNDLVLDATGVSRRHGRFVRGDEGRWWVEDLGSTNGTLVGGRSVRRHALADGDMISVGPLILTYHTSPVGPTGASAGVTICDPPRVLSTTVERAAGGMRSMDAKRLATIYELSTRLLDQRSVAGLVDVAASALIAELDAGVAVFGLTCDPEREKDHLMVRPAAAQVAEITLSRSVLERTIQARRAIVVSDTGSDDDLARAQSIVLAGIRSALCVPMMRDQDVTGFIYVDSRQGGRSYDERDLEFACAVGAMIGTAIENARLHEAELVRQRMEAELARARQVQQAILPSSWPTMPGWDIHGHHVTCREVGGDYCDAIVTSDGRLWLLIADVCGKGAPAALVASSIHAAVHVLAEQCSSPADLLRSLNELLVRHEFESSFVTALAALIAPEEGSALIASAGHPHPICVRESQSPCRVELDTGFLLGVFPDARFTDTSWVFPRDGGTLLMYTDGVSEAFNEAGEQFGEERLMLALSHTGAGEAAGVVRVIQDELQEFRGDRDPTDDLTIIACRRVAEGPSGEGA